MRCLFCKPAKEEQPADITQLDPCVICNARFPDFTDTKSPPSPYRLAGGGCSLVDLYYIDNVDHITYVSHWDVRAGVTVAPSEVGLEIGGGKGGTQERTKHFKRTVVAAQITKL
jgi:hypothetical protein